MAKTLQQISAEIKAAFVANDVLGEAYGLDPALTFDEQFSAVSIEAAIIAVIAYAHYVVERTLDLFRSEIDSRIESSYLCSIPWYYQKVLDYQHGYDLEFNPATYRFDYAQVDESAKIIAFAAVRQKQDAVTMLKIYTNKANNVPLTEAEHSAFVAYMAKVGAAGIHYEFVNQLPDELQLTLQVIFNPLVLDNTGKRLNADSYPVRDSIANYVSGITFGGVLNRTRLIDAIQAADGVDDVILTEIQHRENGGAFEVVSGQNIESISGSFIVDLITDTYTPNV